MDAHHYMRKVKVESEKMKWPLIINQSSQKTQQRFVSTWPQIRLKSVEISVYCHNSSASLIAAPPRSHQTRFISLITVIVLSISPIFGRVAELESREFASFNVENNVSNNEINNDPRMNKLQSQSQSQSGAGGGLGSRELSFTCDSGYDSPPGSVHSHHGSRSHHNTKSTNHFLCLFFVAFNHVFRVCGVFGVFLFLILGEQNHSIKCLFRRSVFCLFVFVLFVCLLFIIFVFVLFVEIKIANPTGMFFLYFL